MKKGFLLLLGTCLLLVGSLKAQISKADAEAFFKEADVTSVKWVLLMAGTRFDQDTQDYLTTKTWYETAKTTLEFKETCIKINSEDELLYIPYRSIRLLYKGMDGWKDDGKNQAFIKIELNENRSLRID